MSNEKASETSRSLSLDVFRGLTIAGMILVNNGVTGDRYGALEHADWNGFTPTDLVFPCFVFIMGISIILSMSRRTGTGQGRGKLLGHIFYRAALIFFLGVLWSIDPMKSISDELAHVRVMGVLQRLALCYLFTSIIVMFTKKRGQIILFGFCLASYWVLMKCVPVPGYGAGILTREGNFAGYIDRLLLSNHLYTPNWDPEGLLHTLPAIGTCLLGVLTGHWLRSEKSLTEKMAGLFVAGNIFMLAGCVMNHYFPINKNLWSPSYVCLTGGIAMNICAAAVWFVDFKGCEKITKPFIWLGANPLFAYLMSMLMTGILMVIPVARVAGQQVMLRAYIFNHLFLSWLNPKNANLAFVLSYVLLWTGITGLMYKKKWFVKI